MSGETHFYASSEFKKSSDVHFFGEFVNCSGKVLRRKDRGEREDAFFGVTFAICWSVLMLLFRQVCGMVATKTERMGGKNMQRLSQ